MVTYPLNEQVSRLIQYINELSQLRQKPITSFRNYEEVLWLQKDIPNEPESRDNFRNRIEDWLYVKKPKRPVAPALPIELEEWVVINSFELTTTVKESTVKEEIIDDQLSQTEVFLEDLPKIQKEINQFLEQEWNPFVVESQRVKKIQKLYDRLFSIHQNLQLNSESIELVLGLGLLQWQAASKNSVERHVLVSEVELFFNKEQAEFVIAPTSKGKVFEYEEDMLLVENRLQGDDSKEIQKLLLELNDENDLITQLESILKNIANALNSNSTYTDTLEAPTLQKKDDPHISLSPAFILRKKTQKGFQKACETAVAQLENWTEDSRIPVNLTNMFQQTSLESEGNTEHQHEPTVRVKQEFYFPLSANEEQKRIISTLNSKSSVLVQGPPGTGKTHTIANLTSHLLATGKRVLITSQTAKALSVLKDKLPEELQDLTVSLLGGDAASIKDLEKVVSTISINKELFDLSMKTAIVEKRETELKELKQELNKTKTKLLEIRESETYVHNFNSEYQGTAQKVAEKINEDAQFFDWYTSEVTVNTPHSYWENEKKLVSEYLRLKSMYPELPEEYSQFQYPALTDSIDLNQIPSAIEEDLKLNSIYESLKDREIEEIQKLLSDLTDGERNTLKDELYKLDRFKKELLFNTYPVLKTVLNDIFMNRGYIWQEIVKRANSFIQIMKGNQGQVEEELFNIGSLSTIVVKKMAEDLYQHVQNGGNLGNFLIKPKIVRQYKIQLEQVTYNGLPIKTTEQVKAFYSYSLLRDAKEHLKEILVPAVLSQDFLSPITALNESESAISQLMIALKIHEWRDNLLNIFTCFSRDTFNEEMIQKLNENIKILELKQRIQANNVLLTKISSTLNETICKKTHPLYEELLVSVQNRNANHFIKLIETYHYYQNVNGRDVTINDIFSKIMADSPTLATSLSVTYLDDIWQQRLVNWEKAFKWKQVKNWLNEFSLRNEMELSKDYDDFEERIKKTITEIGTTKAWIEMLTSMTDSQNKHLKAWSKSVKNIGKGTGKNAARYRREAQSHMEHCIDAIPAWIMPLSQVFENFRIEPNLFDVVIIDEASQSWHDALLLKYMAKKMIIVGDDKQISPTIIGVNDEDVVKLQHKYFSDINFLFGPDLNLKNSFFDICYIMFKETITLREHFRCMPEIIGFSNLISYRDKPLIPLRQYPADRLKPIETVYLPEGFREGTSQNAINEVEAEAIVKKIEECVNDPRYIEKSFGVISLQGAKQAKLIQNKLLNVIGAEIMEERNIICGDAYSFQGDERDVIFLSLVAAKGPTRITALADEKARQRFNVAVSRAKDQLWLMHSITVNELSNRDDMRYQLLSYMANPLKEETESNRSKCESDFERHVFDDITVKGYRVIPQYEVAGYRIDLVVVGEKTKLAVECDGDYWHTSPEDQERDFQRERILQRAGWTFWRILGSIYYFNRTSALESLWNKLDDMGIRPHLEWVEEIESSSKMVVDSKSDNKFPLREKDNIHFNRMVSTENINIKSDLDIKIVNAGIKTGNDWDQATKIEPIQRRIDKTPINSESVSQNNELGNISQSDMLKELRDKGFKVIDHRYISETVWLVGGNELLPIVEDFKQMKVIFRYVEKGHSLTNYKPAWFAKMKPEKVKN